MDVMDKMAVDLRPFVASPVAEDGRLLCENVTLALDYKFFWKGNGLTNITLTRTLGNVLSASGKGLFLLVFTCWALLGICSIINYPYQR